MSTIDYSVHPIKLLAPAKLGEGILCDVDSLSSPDKPSDSIYWVDILSDMVYEYHPHRASAALSYIKDSNLYEGYTSTITPLDSQHKRFLLSMRSGLVIWNKTTNQIERSEIVLPHTSLRFNDGKCDPNGILWIGTTHLRDEPCQASLYSFNPSEANLKLQQPDISISNGLAWSLDHSAMYYIDTPKRQITVFSYNKDDSTIESEPMHTIDLSNELGVPDGMTIDNNGRLYVSMWDGSQILVVDPNLKKVINTIKLPVSRPTNVAISLSTPGRLYVTTSQIGDEPDSGYLFQVDTYQDFLGVQPNYYKEADK